MTNCMTNCPYTELIHHTTPRCISNTLQNLRSASLALCDRDWRERRSRAATTEGLA